MSIQQVLAVIKQGNSASFPNQQAQRVFTNLRRNPRNSMEQINMSASLADQYLQNQVTRNKEFLKSQDMPMMKAPSVDAGANVASLQSVGKILPDQAELTATGQGFVKEKQNLQNAGLPGSSSENNVSSASVALNQVAGVRELQRNREIVRASLQQQVDAGNLRTPISEKLNLTSSKILADDKGERVLQTVPPSLVERRLAALYRKDSSRAAVNYGINPIEQTQRKQNLQLFTGIGDRRLLNDVLPTSVRMAGQNVPVLPVTDFNYNPNVRALTSRLLDSKPVKGEGGKLIYGQGKLGELADRADQLYARKRELQNLGEKIGILKPETKQKIASIDVELGKIDNFYKGLQERGLPLSTTDYTGAPFISADSQVSLKVPSVGALTGPNTAELLAGRKQKARAKQDAYQAAQLPQLRDKLRQLEIQKQELLNKGFKTYSPEVASIQAGINEIYNPAGPKVGLYGGQHNQDLPPYRKGDPIRPQDRGRYFGLIRTSEEFAKGYNQKPPVEVGITEEGTRFFARTYSPAGSKVTTGGDGQISVQNLSDPNELAINPATVERRQERKAKNLPLKGGGGRNVAEYVGGEMEVDEADLAQTFLNEIINAQNVGGSGSFITGVRTNVPLDQLKMKNVREPNIYYRTYSNITSQPRDYQVTGPNLSDDIEKIQRTETTIKGPSNYQDDRTQTGTVKDIYGVRLKGDAADDPEKRPSYVKPSKTPLTKQATPEGKKGLSVSTQLRKIQTDQTKSPERRIADAQALVQDTVKQLTGAVAVGPFTPLSQKPLGTDMFGAQGPQAVSKAQRDYLNQLSTVKQNTSKKSTQSSKSAERKVDVDRIIKERIESNKRSR